MKAVLKRSVAPGVSIEDIPIPEIKDNEVLVQVMAAGICGSDVHMYEGTPNYEWVAPYMPVVIGHEYAGIVVKTGNQVSTVKTGDRVACMCLSPCGVCHMCKTNRRHFCEAAFSRMMGYVNNGGFAEYSAVPEIGCVKLPDNITYEAGALIEPMSVCVNAVNDAGIRFGDAVVVMGPGPIGLMTLLFARASGAGKCIMIGTSKDTTRLELAKRFGADRIVIADETDVTEEIMKETGRYGADVVFEATGVPGLIQTGLDMLTKSGKLVAVGIYPQETKISLTNTVRGAKKIIGTYGGDITWERILNWLSSESYYAGRIQEIISNRTNINDAEAAFQRCVRKENIKEMFTSFV
ncbi:MAG TPA: alcohol dehydrogenase catalytic domain-containing protein [Anaerovoracaceae bacterium]|nr:alcohol dehydrogenase catalytic domain-containing protein [Anaerovoracaceae bacterium]